MTHKSITVADFTSPDAGRHWRIVNDGVMGGLSFSQMTLTPEKTGIFQGTVSLENNGGFASVRTEPSEFGLAGYRGLLVRARGDGKRYQLRLRTDDLHDGIAYGSAFDTVDGIWTTIEIPFQAFKPTYRGRTVPQAPPLEPGRIRRIGFLISGKQEGPFRLEIESVKAFQ